MLEIDKGILDILYEETCKIYPKECCGILLGEISEDGERRTKMLRPATNSAPQNRQGESFFITAEELMREEMVSDQMGMEIIGFYHSHPDEQAEISSIDQTYMIPGLSYPVISVRSGRVTEIKSFEKTFQERTECVSEEEIKVREK